MRGKMHSMALSDIIFFASGKSPPPKTIFSEPPLEDLLTPDDLIDDKIVSRLLGIKRRTVQRWRQIGKGPVFSKYEGSVRYRMADVLAWVEQRRRTRTRDV